MPATAGDITHVKTLAKTVAHLESIETANDDTGDLGFIRVLDRYYTLDKESLLPRDGTNVLYTKNARQGLNPAATPGRWIATCNYLGGCTGGSPGTVNPGNGPISYVEMTTPTTKSDAAFTTIPGMSLVVPPADPLGGFNALEIEASTTFTGIPLTGIHANFRLLVDGAPIPLNGGFAGTIGGTSIGGAAQDATLNKVLALDTSVQHTIELQWSVPLGDPGSVEISIDPTAANQHATLLARPARLA